MPTNADSPAPNGDAENNNNIPENPKSVKRNFSLKENEIVNAIDLTDDKNLSVIIENQSGAKKYKIICDYILETLGGQPIVLSDGILAKIDRSDALHMANKSANRKMRIFQKLKLLLSKRSFILKTPARNIISLMNLGIIKRNADEIIGLQKPERVHTKSHRNV